MEPGQDQNQSLELVSNVLTHRPDQTTRPRRPDVRHPRRDPISRNAFRTATSLPAVEASGIGFNVDSRLPDEDDAVRLWDHVLGLAAFPGFAELKRSLRELPQLRGLGVDPGEVGVEQDWHGGSRRTKR